MKILFLGSSEFSVGVLQRLLESRHKVVAVICQPDRPCGRGHKLTSPIIKEFAQTRGISVLQFEKVNQNIDEIFSLDFDVFVTASFGQILSREFLSKKLGLNVHPSKLPKYRGATPLQTALLNGDTKTAVTVQKMVYEVDSGDIILSQDLAIDEEDDFLSLSEKSSKIGGELLVKALNLIEEGKAVFLPQNDNFATYTKMIKKEDGFLDFNCLACEIVNKVRALAYNPGCYFYINEERIKVAKATICQDFDVDIGEILIKNKEFLIKAKKGAVCILRCQAQGGKMLDAKDFLNGYTFKSNRVNEWCF